MMVNSPRFQESHHHITGLLPSPNSSTSSSTTSTGSNGLYNHRPPPTPPPQSPVPVTRSDPNSPYPTTFVQADSSSFKQVVQMLTGSPGSGSGSVRTEPAPLKPHSHSHSHSIPLIKSAATKKLYERRNSLKNFKLSPLAPGLVARPVFSAHSPRELLSPSILDFPSLALSPVTPLIPDPFNRSPQSGSSSNSSSLEEKAIAEKGFYFHPSPSTTPRESEPRLLPLFPVTSPRVSGSS